MPLLSGAMGFRRYRVINAPSSLAGEDMLEALAKHAFRKPPSAATGGENTGWVNLHNLCVTDFPYDECWFNQYFVFSLRIDNKRLPSQLLRAMVDLRVRDWLAESGREKIPGGLKTEIKEQIELELFPKQLPAVAAHNVAWDTSSHILRFFNTSERVNEMFRILFFRTFGFETRPVGTVELVSAHSQASKWMPTLDRLGHCDYRPEANR
jgi:DNA recombination-dependent growth factor C